MAVVFLEGILILLLVLCGLRKAVSGMPSPYLSGRAIGIGIGLFIAFIGLMSGGFIARRRIHALRWAISPARPPLYRHLHHRGRGAFTAVKSI